MNARLEILPIDDTLRLRRFDEICSESRVWYSDPETVWLVDGVREPYDEEKLSRMYSYLNRHYELYWIETDDGGSLDTRLCASGRFTNTTKRRGRFSRAAAFANTKRLKRARVTGSSLERKQTLCRPQ